MIYMAKDTLYEEAPSRAEKFAKKVERMIRPLALKTIEFSLFGKGAGTDIWEMLCAALKGDLQTIQQLVEKNPDLVECQYNYTQPIHFAVREGHVDVVSYLLERGANPSYRTYFYGDSLLTMALDRGHDAVVQILEEALRKRDQGFSSQAAELIEAVSGRDYANIRAILGESPQLVNASDLNGETPLHRAVKIDDFYMIRYLIDKGADVNAQRSDGFKPIHLAFYRNNYWVRKDNLLMVGYLLAKGAEYNINTAAALGDLQQVREFLEADASLANFNDSCRKRPISAAAERGYAEIVKLLLEHGADPNEPEAQAPKGYALWAAVRANQIDIARTLLEHGADPNAHVESSGPPLEHAEGDMYELLRAHGADEPHPFFTAVLDHDVAAAEQLLKENPDLVNRDDLLWGEGVMTLPAKRAQFDMLKLLRRYGARVPDVSKWGQSYYFKHYDVAKFLLENGMNPNHRNWLQITLLHDMAAAGNMDKAKLLLDCGADINPRDEEYCSTPLGFAARWGRKELVEFLLERGAATNLPDDEPWATPLAWAEKNVHTEIAEILRKHGANR